MRYRVDLAERAARDLRHIFLSINADDGPQARAWFNGLKTAVLSLGEQPSRGALIPEGGDFRHLLYGHRWHRYRIIYTIDEDNRVVTVLHIRHGARDVFLPGEPNGDA